MQGATVANRVLTLAALVGVASWLGASPVLPTDALAADYAQHQTPACTTAPSVEVLKRLCPAPSDTVSEECFAALETRYLHRPVFCDSHASPSRWTEYRPPSWALPRNDLLVWQDVFDDVVALRKRVEAATHDPACRLREHEFDPALRGPCAADAMTRLAVLHRACRGALAWEEEANTYFYGWRYAWDELRAALDEWVDDDHWQRVANVDESELHFAWRMAKCRAVPKPVLELLPRLRPPSHYERTDQHDLLIVAAARLGSPWALAMTGVSNSFRKDTVAVELWPDPILPLAYAALGQQAGQSGLAYLLAARAEDLRSETPWFDWRGLERSYSAEEVRAALPVAKRVREHGWPPRCIRQRGDSPWPWADLPTVVRREFVRRRIDEQGNIRWVYRSGAEERLEHGVPHYVAPDGEELIFYHSALAQPTVRRWTDADGTERWIDESGNEHWLDADGMEHWIDLDGTEWILLPIGDPFPEDRPTDLE